MESTICSQFEDFGRQVADVCSRLQEYFHRLCPKIQDTRICGGCIEKAGILHSEIMFEGMGPYQKVPSEYNHFSRRKKCIGLCRLDYLQEHGESSENMKLFEPSAFDLFFGKNVNLILHSIICIF